jgi:Carboxypeptidase regulatory-like domain
LEVVVRLRLVLAVVFLATTASLAVAQITSATIAGTIKDETGGVLPGVDVVVRNLDTGLTRSVVTDANGYFTVPGLAPGGDARTRRAPPCKGSRARCRPASRWKSHSRPA